MKQGRPIEYKEEYIEKVNEYLETCIDEEGEYHKTRGQNSDSFERTLTVNLPTIEGFALYIKVAVSSLYAWAKLNEDFSKALELIKVEQKKRLLDKGLNGQYNSTIAKLILSSNHDMREKADVTTDGKSLTLTFDTSFNNGGSTS